MLLSVINIKKYIVLTFLQKPFSNPNMPKLEIININIKLTCQQLTK